MRILQIANDIRPDRGGPSRSVSGLCKALSELGHDVVLYIHDSLGSEKCDVGATKIVFGCSIKQFLFGFRPDIAHLHGVWIPDLHFDVKVLRSARIPYIIAPRGSFDEWSMRQKKIKKMLALWIYQRADTSSAVAMHATCNAERQCCYKYGKCKKVILSPNGINFPIALPEWSQHRDGKRRLLFLSRMNPKKRVVELLRAWAEVDHEGWVCELVYSTSGDEVKYEQCVRNEINRLRLEHSVIMTGPLDDDAKWSAYRRADCFVLPTHTENFGIVIAEALYAGLPVITTHGAPWKSINDNGCGWWIDHDGKSLREALTSMMSLSDESRRRMGQRGHELVTSLYSWREIASNLVNQYQTILDGL